MESKSVYEPPTGDDVLLRKIHISPYNQNRIGLIIGKEGHNFIKITEKFNSSISDKFFISRGKKR